MTTVYVQFSDSSNTTVISVFGCPQDPTAYPNQGELDSADPRYQSFMNPITTVSGQMAINEAAIQEYMNKVVAARGYSSTDSACKYASSIPFVAPANATPLQYEIAALQEKFRLEGNAVQEWVSLTWATAYIYINQVTEGQKPMPTKDEAVALVPPFTWPD